MKKQKWISIIIVLFLLLAGFKIFNKSSKNEDGDLVSKTNYLMGTIVNLKIYDEVSDDVFSGAFDVVRDIEQKMSLNIDNSELNDINKNANKSPVNISDEMAYVINESLEYSNLSKGYFDISIGPLVELWGIGSENAKLPTQNEIDKVLPKIDYKNIVMDDNKISLKDDGMILDLGAIAKGYATDEVTDYLKSSGVKRAIIDLGGNLYALGSKDESTPWSIGIQNPFYDNRGNYLGILKTSNKSIVTSGVYERFLEIDGKRYHHILNPFDGYPIDNDLMSVTIVSDKSIDGDALSTSVFSLGLNDGYKLVDSLERMEAIFVTKDKNVYITSGLKDSFEIKDEDFKIKPFK